MPEVKRIVSIVFSLWRSSEQVLIRFVRRSTGRKLGPPERSRCDGDHKNAQNSSTDLDADPGKRRSSDTKYL